MTLADGRYQSAPFAPGGASRTTVRWLPGLAAFGDLDGDGVAEGVVLLVAETGGSGSFRHVAAVALRGDRAVSVATAPLGDRVRVRALSVEQGVVRIELVRHAPGDPACCPTRGETRELTLRDGRLVETASGPAGTRATSGLHRMRGELVWGHEVRSFRECGSQTETWVVDATGGELREASEALASGPYAPLFVELRGRIGPAPARGFGADYDGALTVVELRHAARESRGCDEDLSGVEFRARGNEPFWSLEIRPSGIRLLRLGAAARSYAYRPPRRGDGGWTYLADAKEPPGSAVEIRIREQRCVDAMSGERFAFRASVRTEGERLEGCALEGP